MNKVITAGPMPAEKAAADSSKVPYGFVYIVTNRVNGKVYVGQTTGSVKRRWQHHIGAARCGVKRVICAAIRKYGPDCFNVEEVAKAYSLQELNSLEASWVSSTKADNSRFGYNRTGGGDSGYTTEARAELSRKRRGRILSKAHRNAISAGHKGKIKGALPPEHRAKLSAALKGRQKSDTHLASISAALKGRSVTPEQRLKLSAAHKGQRPSEANRNALAAVNTGRSCSPETRAKISAANKGKKHSLESRKAMSAAHTGVALSAEHRAAQSKGMKTFRRNSK